MHYSHTQFATFLVAGLLIPMVAISVLPLYLGVLPWVLPLVLVVLIIALGLFYSLHVDVGAGTLECRFGIGLIRKRIRLADIQEVRAVTNPWIAGWGIRWMPGYWMWNVSGLRAVELTFRDGSRFRIGTDEPEVLVKAIELGKTLAA